jgi:hypothetical protein
LTGAFLGISLGPEVRLPEPALRRIAAIRTALPGRERRVWGQPGVDPCALIAWERPDGLGAVASFDDDHAEIWAPSKDVGIHTRLRADRRSIRVDTDQLGYGSIFRWSHHGVAALSTRPELLAALAVALGRPPTKDLTTAQDLSFIGWIGSRATGWSEIRALGGDETVTMEDGAIAVQQSPTTTPWTSRTSKPPSVDDLVDQAADELLTNLRAILAMGEPVFADLTAGRDSRMILAGLVALDAHRQVTFQTIGDSDLADVRVAQRLTTELEAPYRHGFFFPLPDDPLPERLRRHAATTAGMANPRDGLREPCEPIAQLRVSGLIGEVLRGWRTSVSKEKPAAQVVKRIARAFGAGALPLLRSEAAERAGERIHAEILGFDGADVPGWHVAHRYYSQVRLRSRMSRVDDMTPEARVYPLYSRGLVEVGIEAMWHQPDADLATLIIERLAPGLDLLSTDAVPPTTSSPTAPSSAAKPPSFMQVAVAQQAEERRSMFSTLSTIDSGAWESIDHALYVAAVERYDKLNNGELGLLNAAAATILWLAD